MKKWYFSHYKWIAVYKQEVEILAQEQFWVIPLTQNMIYPSANFYCLCIFVLF